MANNATPAGATIMLAALPSPVAVKLHTGDPTDAGTANVSTQYPAAASVALGTAAAGARASSADAVWAASTGVETVTHLSIWNAAATSCLFTGPFDAPIPTNAEPFSIEAGDLVLTTT